MTNREWLISMARGDFRKALNSRSSVRLSEWISDNLGKSVVIFAFTRMNVSFLCLLVVLMA